MVITIDNDNGEVMIGSTVLPGVFESIEVEDDTQTDQVEIQGKEKKSNNRIAYNPTLIRLNLTLVNDDKGSPVDKLKIIRNLYRPSKRVTTPQNYDIVSDETEAHGVEKVTFAAIRSRATNLADTIYVNLEFEEYISITVPVRERQVSSSTTTYTVQSGDTLSAIASKFGSTVQDIAAANNISDVNLIYTGQKLVIPAPDQIPAPVYASAEPTSDSRSWSSSDIGTAVDDDDPYT